MRIVGLGAEDLGGLHKSWRIARLVAEVGEEGLPGRELGYDELGRIAHRWPGGESMAERSVRNLLALPSTAADITAEQFEALWSEAIKEEAFWLENDPYGDRYGTAIPWWGCLLAIGALALAAYVLFWS